jgi:hypothetical protein
MLAVKLAQIIKITFKMRLIENNSPLKCLPQSLGLKDMIIFDAIRFTCEMIDSTVPNFKRKILEVTYNNTEKNAPSIFLDCWTIIDNAARVEKIFRKLPWENPDELLSDFVTLRLFRNTFQHLEDRIDKTISITEMPLYGIISWIHKIPNKNIFTTYQLISGNALEGIGKYASVNVGGNDNNNLEIQELNLHTFDNSGNKLTLNIDNLIFNLKKLVTELEKRFKENQNQYNWIFLDWTKRQDIILIIQDEN